MPYKDKIKRREYAKKWREKNAQKRRTWEREWYQKNKKECKERLYSWRQKHPKARKIEAQKYYQNHKQEIQRKALKKYYEDKLEAFQMISKKKIPECINCGCRDLRVLEINHKNGFGTKERKEKRIPGTRFYGMIVQGKRSIEDLEITCRVCNARHYCKREFGIDWHIQFIEP